MLRSLQYISIDIVCTGRVLLELILPSRSDLDMDILK